MFATTTTFYAQSLFGCRGLQVAKLPLVTGCAMSRQSAASWRFDLGLTASLKTNDWPSKRAFGLLGGSHFESRDIATPGFGLSALYVALFALTPVDDLDG